MEVVSLLHDYQINVWIKRKNMLMIPFDDPIHKYTYKYIYIYKFIYTIYMLPDLVQKVKKWWNGLSLHRSKV